MMTTLKKNNVLITGCAGFIGSHAVEHFLEKGDTVIGVDCLTYAGNLENISNLKNDNFTFYHMNICSTEFVEKICRDHNVDWIINFAAETHVDNSIKSCDGFVYSNIIGVTSLLEVCRAAKIKLFHISTDEVYGSIKEGSFTETVTLNPKNPYSATKAAAEHMVRAYQNTYGVDHIIVRPSNNFGPKQHKEKFIPTILKNILNNKKVPIYGDGTNVRDWFYVKDTVKIIRDILLKSDLNCVYNITNNNERTNIEIVKFICEFLRKDFETSIEFIKDRPGHDFRYSISSEKYKKLGIEYNSDFEKAMKETINYYLDFKE